MKHATVAKVIAAITFIYITSYFCFQSPSWYGVANIICGMFGVFGFAIWVVIDVLEGS